MLEPEAARPRVEGGKFVAAKAAHRDAMRFEIFERLVDVENRLGAGADHGDAGARQFDEVGRDVEGFFRAAMHAADAAGGEDLDAGEVGDVHGRCDRRARSAVARRDRGEVAARGLDHAARQPRQPLDLVARQADLEAPVEHGDRRRRGALVAHGVLEHQGRLEIGRKRHPMGDDRRLERDDRFVTGQRLGDFRRNFEQRIRSHANRLLRGRARRLGLIISFVGRGSNALRDFRPRAQCVRRSPRCREPGRAPALKCANARRRARAGSGDRRRVGAGRSMRRKPRARQ